MNQKDDTVRAMVTLGHSDVRMRPIGLGCMGMSQSYGEADRAESIATIQAAIDMGVGMLDTSDIYGAAQAGREPEWFGHNERLIGEALAGRRDRAIIATKFGAVAAGAGRVTFNGAAPYVKAACEASLRRLGTDVIDLYYYHRRDPNTPIEETIGAMGELVREGKVRAIGVSEFDAASLRTAAAVHPISALQSEYSLWERSIEKEVIPACRELGVTLVPYSPLGRAILTGAISDATTFADGDYRGTVPKFAGDNLSNNLRLVEGLKAFADRKGFTPGQIALAWLIAQPLDVAPIPGTKRIRYVEQNLAATEAPLSRDEVAWLADLFDPGKVTGARYAWGNAASAELEKRRPSP